MVSTPQTDDPYRLEVPPLVQLDNVRKSFGGVRALEGVSFHLVPGEVHALLGENGAGKSTLIKILSGVNGRDGGAIKVRGRETTFRSPAESRAAGIAVVYQELSLVPSLSVAANLFLDREPRNALGLVNHRQMNRDAAASLQHYGIDLDPRRKVEDLAFPYRQMTEICKALMGDVRILVLDEPTSALSAEEEEVLFDAIRQVTQRGVGVIYVTHRLNEVFRISQRVTIFRDGQNAGTYATADTTMHSLVAGIVGREPTSTNTVEPAASRPAAAQATAEAPPGVSTPPDLPVLEMRDVANDRLQGINLGVVPSEIHGFAGIVGSGRTEILETIFGLRNVLHGTIRVDGTPQKLRKPSDAIRLGIAMVSEDRRREGLVLDHSIERNVTLPRLSQLARLGWYRRSAGRNRSRAAIKDLSVKAPSASTPVGNLSGGNQQKIVFAKWRDPQLKLLLLDEPTVGVDVGAREEIYGLIRRAAQDGAGALVVSSDLAELLLLCHRISIVAHGQIVTTTSPAEIGTEENLHHLIQQSLTQESP